MKTFKKKIDEVKRTRLLIAIIILALALGALIWGVIELIPREIHYSEFDKNNDSSQYIKTKVQYITGPIIEATDSKTGEKFRYYVAVNLDDNLFIVRTGEETNIPIYGKDVTEENKNSIGEIEIYGSPDLISGSLIIALGSSLNTIFGEDIVDKTNLTQVMGAYYFDTVPPESNLALSILLLSLMLAVIGGIYLYVNIKIRRKVDVAIENLKEQGELDKVIDNYEGGQLVEYKSVKVSLSPEYLYSYNKTLDVVKLNDITSATISKKQFGNKDKNRYIIITTKQNQEYYIAGFRKRKQKKVADELLEKIKSIIEQN